MINHVDDQIRRLLSPITGVQKMTDGNTVVMLTSDHGEMLGDHYLYHKRLPYEPSARVPLMISVPDAPAGLTCDEPVCLEDIMPTILELAGAEIPNTVEGRSLASFLRGEDPDWRDSLHIEHAPAHQSLTDGREKYIWFVRDGHEQFFDLTTDPEERHDLIDSDAYQDAISRWRRRLIEKLQDRPEGFSDGAQLIPGRPYAPLLSGPG
jgi:arylsulfatase A-like enzyme